jgi:YaiO family outer membrane protein
MIDSRPEILHNPSCNKTLVQLRQHFHVLVRHAPFGISRGIRVLLPLIITLICSVTPGFGQSGTNTLTPDQLFMKARQEALTGDREEARRLCRVILARNPEYVDVRILLARTYAWDAQYVEARSILKLVLRDHPTIKDALEALVDVELWDTEYETALNLANQGLASYPRDEELLLKKAKALNGLERGAEALTVLLVLEEMNPSRKEIVTLMESIKARSALNGAGVTYAFDRFSDVYDLMNYASLQLSRNTSYGSVFARLNYTDRFHFDGTQLEFDLYPRITDGVYAYVNYGYSASTLFPKHRLGAEIYTKLPSSFEGSVGLRFLSFDPSTRVTMYTGTLGFYFGNYWVSFRPYFIPNDAAVTNSATVTLRRYVGDGETYVSLRAGAGFSADERSLQSSAGFSGKDVFYLKSQTFGVGWQQNVSAVTLLSMSFDVVNQELSFSPGNYITMYSCSIGIRTRF